MVDAEYHRNRKRERRNKYIEMLGGKCERCGSREDLHFDHKDPSKKEFHISRMINAPEDVVIKEVKKCRLLCNDCHREKTRENWEFGAEESEHGTLWRYKKYKCRCDKCRKAMSDYYHSRTASTDLVIKTAEIDHPIREFTDLMRVRSKKVIGLMNQMLDICSVVMSMGNDQRDDYLYDFFWRAIDATDIKSIQRVTNRIATKMKEDMDFILDAISHIPLYLVIETFQRIFAGSYTEEFKNLHTVMDNLTNGEYKDQIAWNEQDRQLADAILRLPALWSEAVFVCNDTAKRLSAHSQLLNKRPASDDVETLYHATVNTSDLLDNGFRNEWDDDSGKGLGGSSSLEAINTKGVSFTSDLYVAKEIARCFKELIMIANGEVTGRQLLEWMSDSDRKRVLQSVKEVHGTIEFDTPQDVVNLYKVYLFLTKRYDPLFMKPASVLVESFSQLSADNVGIVKAKINMRHPDIVYLSAMHEYRVPPDAILSVDGLVG